MKVKYSVNPNEKWEDVKTFFDEYPAAMEQLRTRFAVGRQDFNLLSVRGMLEAVNGQVPEEWARLYKGKTVREWCEMVNALKEGLENFTAFMESTQPPYTLRQKKMTFGTLKGNLEEAVLMTLKSCFALHDLEAATKLTVYEYKMARREAYNDAVINYNQAVAMDLAAFRR